jgi:hypothetical protein
MTDKKRQYGYVSEADQFLSELHSDSKNWTEAVHAEVEKHRKIKQLRDNPNMDSQKSKLWSDF